MESLSVFELIFLGMLSCCGVVFVGKGLLTNRVESVGLGAVCLIIGGALILVTSFCR